MDLRKGSRAFARCGLGRRDSGSEFAGLDLVRLGQNHAVADSGLVEHLHHVAVHRLDAVARVDEEQRAFQHDAAAQEIAHQAAPLLGDRRRRLGEAVAGHVDEPDLCGFAHFEEIELLGAARGDGRAGDGIAPGQRVEQRGLADIGAAGKRDFGHFGIGQELERRRGLEERDRPCEQAPRAFFHLGPRRGFCFGIVHHRVFGLRGVLLGACAF